MRKERALDHQNMKISKATNTNIGKTIDKDTCRKTIETKITSQIKSKVLNSRNKIWNE